ncbi:PREDICTED: uncharacterized protein LOC108769439 isoform X2 [Trachymyrmex cornetzi]|uniref:CHK kinase-like domain-containing protein n=2 Tax=Trachymyrmex cornetzi TaxID=471704 RepID=A0A151ISQ2_9HYME|nr:PREDICTED: uncharacterized protein LOC108769439 isoform X2 [Trachymyrmex cornetzi]XP_018375950.1 PREDICTED: uncharacterized protein LOC108769439 isoform X2 [Trachymyrmex cornetzi]KYN09869.1 hypothetical protein ALC57_17992 [Trachymyrmex cornetzi]
MADPDLCTKFEKLLKKYECKYCYFIKWILIPEMIDGRYFCEPGSREFVELDSIDVEHLDRKTSRKNVLHRVMARVNFSGETCSFPLIVKLPKQNIMETTLCGSFLNEEMFYSKMTLNYGTDGISKCYASDLGRFDGQAVIVLEDLVASGYKQVAEKLNENHLKLCMKALATFHGKGLKLKAHKFPIFREFYAKLSEPIDWLHLNTSPGSVRTSELMVESTLDNPECLDTSLYSVLPVEATLSEKIRAKHNITSKLEFNDFWTICHGNFTRSNLFFRYENGYPSDVKVIDWSTMRYCSPSIDFGQILLENLPDDNNLAKVKAFCQNMLEIYLDAVKDVYLEVDRELLERDVIAKLPFAYGMIENRMLRKTGMMLRALDQLGSFD